MSNRRCMTAGLLALCGATRWVMAQPMGVPPIEPQPRLESAVGETRYGAQIVFVNVTGDWASLRQAIGDLLLMHRITPHFEQRPAFTQQDLLAQEPWADPQRATVWIVMQHPQQVRLVFADPLIQRFLVRDIPLPQGLDDLGRETVAQVVESSMLSLREGSVGMSRSEVKTVFAPSSSSSVESTPSASRWRASPDAPAPAEAAPRHFRARFGVNYQAVLTGRDFGPEHGPGVAVGLEYLRAKDSFIALGAFEWRFEKEHRDAEFKLTVQNNLAWLLLGWRKPTPDSAVVVLVGPGLQLSRVRPTLIVNDAAASTTDHLVHVTPWVRLAAGLESDRSGFALQVLGKLDVSAYKTHYDIARDGTSVPLASTWVAQPGIVVSVFWR
jgi:hypothetical protein